jgi:hypothetical protein
VPSDDAPAAPICHRLHGRHPRVAQAPGQRFGRLGGAKAASGADCRARGADGPARAPRRPTCRTRVRWVRWSMQVGSATWRHGSRCRQRSGAISTESGLARWTSAGRREATSRPVKRPLDGWPWRPGRPGGQHQQQPCQSCVQRSSRVAVSWPSRCQSRPLLRYVAASVHTLVKRGVQPAVP